MNTTFTLILIFQVGVTSIPGFKNHDECLGHAGKMAALKWYGYDAEASAFSVKEDIPHLPFKFICLGVPEQPGHP
jgi:hypothetical protein